MQSLKLQGEKRHGNNKGKRDPVLCLLGLLPFKLP